MKSVILKLIVCPERGVSFFSALLVFRPNSPTPRKAVCTYSFSLIKKNAASSLDSCWDHSTQLSNPMGVAVCPAAPNPFLRGWALPLMDSWCSGACSHEQCLIFGTCWEHIVLVAWKQAWVHLDSPGFAVPRDLPAVLAQPLICCMMGQVPAFLMNYRYS